MFHDAPSRLRPQMYAPSRAAESTSSKVLRVTSVIMPSLSSSRLFRRDVICITAVRKLCGLKKYDTLTHIGTVVGLSAHCRFCCDRIWRLVTHDPRDRRHGYARTLHVSGTWFRNSES